MSKTKLKQWKRLETEIRDLYAIEHTMPVADFLAKLKPLRERQDIMRDK